MTDRKNWHRLLMKNTEDRTGVCSKCGPVKIIEKTGKDYWFCALSYRDTTRSGHPLTITESRNYCSLVGACEICGEEDLSKLVPDHLKGTKLVRGVLCLNCNVAIGHLRHNTSLLIKALEYLEYWEDKYDDVLGA